MMMLRSVNAGVLYHGKSLLTKTGSEKSMFTNKILNIPVKCMVFLLALVIVFATVDAAKAKYDGKEIKTQIATIVETTEDNFKTDDANFTFGEEVEVYNEKGAQTHVRYLTLPCKATIEYIELGSDSFEAVKIEVIEVIKDDDMKYTK